MFAFDNKLKKAFIFSSNLDKEFKVETTHEIRLLKAKNLYAIPRINSIKDNVLGFKWVKDFTKKKYISIFLKY